MKNFEQSPKTRVAEATDAIVKSPEQIENEFLRTANSWLACFGTRVFVIETYLDGKQAATELGSERYHVVQERIEALKEKLHDLREQYPEKDPSPPDAIKQELLAMLDVLK